MGLPVGLHAVRPSSALADERPGVVLRDVREREGLTREAIAQSLRIPLRILRALEEGDYASLPPNVYVRGFIRQYADVLGLDPVPLIRALERERAHVPRMPASFPWMLRSRRRARLWDAATPRLFALLGGGAALLAVLFYVLAQVRTYARPPRLEIVRPAADEEVRVRTLTVQGRTDPTAELSVNGERTAVRDDGGFEETIGIGDGVNTLRFVARSIGGRETVAVREVLLRPSPPGTTAGPSLPPAGRITSGPFSLTVRAEGETVWIALTVDGKPAFTGLLLPGSEQTVSGEQITLSSGKAAHTLVRVGGEEPRPLADRPGPIHDVAFTRDPRTGTITRHEPQEVPRE